MVGGAALNYKLSIFSRKVKVKFLKYFTISNLTHSFKIIHFYITITIVIKQLLAICYFKLFNLKIFTYFYLSYLNSLDNADNVDISEPALKNDSLTILG